MGKKQTTDWRELVGKPGRIQPGTEQPTTAMRRTYCVGRVAVSERISVGAHSFTALDYNEFMAFAERIKQVHELSPGVLISISHFGELAVRATVYAEETPEETRERLLQRRKQLRAQLKSLCAEKIVTGSRELHIMDQLAEIEPLLGRKPKAKKPRRKPK